MSQINEYDVVIIGAGQCGMLLGYYLEKYNISYVILEKDRAFSSWYTRWDNFSMNTANWMNQLPGIEDLSSNNRRSSKKQIISYFEQWMNSFSPTIKIDCVQNIKLEKSRVIIDSDKNSFNTKLLVFAVGLNKIVIPTLQYAISINNQQLHSSEYRNINQIKTTKVLIVGTGSSGVQICEELAKTNKFSINLSCSKNKYFSWTIFGIPIYNYVKIFKLFDIRNRSVLGWFIRMMSKNKGDPATPPHPELLASLYEVKLIGRLVDINNNIALFDDQKTVNLENTTIIWCTGYQLDLTSMIDTSQKNILLDRAGYPKLKSNFQSSILTIYFIGLRFQRLISSHILYGAVKDAKYLATEIKLKLKKILK